MASVRLPFLQRESKWESMDFGTGFLAKEIEDLMDFCENSDRLSCLLWIVSGVFEKFRIITKFSISFQRNFFLIISGEKWIVRGRAS